MTSAAASSGIHPAFYVLSWMFFSNSTIIFNKWLIGTAGFAIILTTIHLFTTVLFTQFLARFTHLLPLPQGRTGILTRRTGGHIVAIGLCYTASLLCSNMAYLTLSVPFISMLKALAPVTTLVLSCVGGFNAGAPTRATWAKVSVITFGVFLSSVGEVTFAWSGFAYQMVGTVSESVRLLLIAWLLASPAAGNSDAPPAAAAAAVGGVKADGGADYDDEHKEDVEDGKQSMSGSETEVDEAEGVGKTGAWQEGDVEAQGGAERNALAGMNPLVLLYYYAPVCAVFNLLVALMTEWRTFDPADLHRVGWSMLALNGAVAFMLNVSSVFLIGKTSALAMNLTGILKSVLLVFAAILIWNTPITFIQSFGYTIALIGLLIYALPDDTLRQSAVGEAATTHLGEYANKIGNSLGLLGLWNSRSGGEGRYTSVSDDVHDEEHEDSFLLNRVEERNEEAKDERNEKLARD